MIFAYSWIFEIEFDKQSRICCKLVDVNAQPIHKCRLIGKFCFLSWDQGHLPKDAKAERGTPRPPNDPRQRRRPSGVKLLGYHDIFKTKNNTDMSSLGTRTVNRKLFFQKSTRDPCAVPFQCALTRLFAPVARQCKDQAWR